MGSSASCIKHQNHSYDAEKIRKIFPVINDVETLTTYIEYAKRNNHYELIKKKFKKDNFLDDNDNLTTGEKPFNIFARIAAGKTNQNVDQSLLGNHSSNFIVCHNKPENDENWNNPDFPAASMAGPDENGPGHVFITTKNLSYHRFNILPIILENNVRFLSEMLLAAIEYTKNRKWSRPGFYFHCYPHNTVQSLHLHVINMETVGPWFKAGEYKNLNIHDVLSIMKPTQNPYYAFM